MTLTNNLKNKSKEELEKIAEAVAAFREKQKYNKISSMFPEIGPFRKELYPKHLEFFAAGKDHRFRLLRGANRTGKSTTGACEIVYHATGEYPKDWQGRVLRNPKNIWIVGVSGTLLRDTFQKILFGQSVSEVGTGLFPKACIIDYGAMPGITGGIGTAIIKHKKGHNVNIVMKTYEMHVDQFMGAKVDIIAFDEEPPESIYSECMLRLMGAGKEPGISMLLFTPLKGYSEVVMKYTNDGIFPDDCMIKSAPERWSGVITWNDIPHLSNEDKEAMLAEIPLHERQARTMGIPSLGKGRIFPVDETFITVKPFKIPSYFEIAFGIDFGWNNTAVIWGAKDPQTQVIYLYTEYKRGEVEIGYHANAIKAKGNWIKGACDPSGRNKNQMDGTTFIANYKKLGVDLIASNNDFDASVQLILHLFESGQLKIFSNLEKLIKELRFFRYDSVNVNKPAKNQDDHLIDAMRYLIAIFDHVSCSEDTYFDSEYDDIYDGITSNKSNRDTLTGY